MYPQAPAPGTHWVGFLESQEHMCEYICREIYFESQHLLDFPTPPTIQPVHHVMVTEVGSIKAAIYFLSGILMYTQYGFF